MSTTIEAKSRTTEAPSATGLRMREIPGHGSLDTLRGRCDLVVRFRTEEYERWNAAFDEQRELRVKHGATGHILYRNASDPNDFELVITFTSGGGARGYTWEVAWFNLQRMAAMDAGRGRRGHWDETIRETIDAVSYR